MTKAPNATKNHPRSSSTSLKNGNASDVDSGSRLEQRDQQARRDRDGKFDRQHGAARQSPLGLLGHLQIIVVEADQAEAQRHRSTIQT